jgi:sec-independent protein translocase protein TatA
MRVGPLGIPEIIAILAVVLLIFGARRLPEIGSSMGKGIRTFKSALMGEDDNKPEDQQPAAKAKEDNNPY